MDRPVHDPCGRADGLEFAHERSRVDAGVALGDDDVVGRDLAGVDRRRRLRGLELAVEAERVPVGADQPDLSGDLVAQAVEPLADLLQGANEQRVAADAQLRVRVQLPAHLLELAARDAGDVDDADALVALDGRDEVRDLLPFPLGQVLCLAFSAHQATSTAGPIVVFT